MALESTIATPEIAAFQSLCRRWGGEPDLVQGGGGNASFKVDDQRIRVKASGSPLRESRLEDFIELDREALRVLKDEVVADEASPAERDQWFRDRVLATRLAPGKGRPSMDTLIHAWVPARFVLHAHPVPVLALVAAEGGPELAAKLFPRTSFAWAPYRRPGIDLARAVAETWATHQERYGSPPIWMFLENHGVIVYGETAGEVDTSMRLLLVALRQWLGGDDAVPETVAVPEPGDAWTTGLSGEPDCGLVQWSTDPRVVALAMDPRLLDPALVGGLTPDQVLHLGGQPLLLEAGDGADEVRADARAFTQREGHPPRLALVRGVGVLIAGRTLAEVEAREAVAATHARVLGLIRRHSRPRPLPPGDIRALLAWEWGHWWTGQE